MTVTLSSKKDFLQASPNHSNRVFFGELSFLQYAFEKLSTSGKFECKIIFRSRFKPLVKLDLKKLLEIIHDGNHKEYTRCWDDLSP